MKIKHVFKWPPHCEGKAGAVICPADGRLFQVQKPSRKKIIFSVSYRGEKHTSSLEAESAKTASHISNLLQENIGITVSQIGELELPAGMTR